MPVCLVKAAPISSSAFFIEAAAKTVTLLSCAMADWPTAPATIMATTVNRVRRGNMVALLDGARASAPQTAEFSGSGRSGSAVPEGKARGRRATGRDAPHL